MKKRGNARGAKGLYYNHVLERQSFRLPIKKGVNRLVKQPNTDKPGRNNPGGFAGEDPDKLTSLRQKLGHKAKQEPHYRFYSLYGFLYRPDILDAAWHKVKTNKGGRTAGVDGVSIRTVEESAAGVDGFLFEIEVELREKSYRASPVKRVYIEKANGKKRPLGIPTLKDRVVQAAMLLILEPIFEADFLDCSYGFRPERSAHDALNEIKGHLKEGLTAVYDADLEGYFDSIPHDKLIACLQTRISDRQVLKLIRQWLRAPVIEHGSRRGKRRDKGTPQGGIMSPLLANLYLHFFDKLFNNSKGPKGQANARLVRYADDFVVLARYIGPGTIEFIEESLEGRMGLKINREKTSVINLKDDKSHLDFLGFTFKYDRDKFGRNRKYLHIQPSKQAVAKLCDRIRVITSPKMFSKPTSVVIAEINRLLIGWRNYFNFGYPWCTYNFVEHFVRNRMIRHLNRRSQRSFHAPKDRSDYQHLHEYLGLIKLNVKR